MNLQFTELIRNRSSARVLVIAVLIVILAPAFVFASFLAVSSARLERAQLEQNGQNKSREVTAAIERHVVGIENVLVALGSSPRLQRGNIEGFYDQAVEVSRQVGLQLVLHDSHLRQMVNTALPAGTPLNVTMPAPVTAAYQELLRSRKPAVSDVFWGPLIKKYVVAVLVPVFAGDDLQFVLGAGVPTEVFAGLVGSLDIHAEQVVNVIDRNGIFITRSLDHDGYAGKKITYLFPLHAQRVVRGTGGKGIASHWFTHQSNPMGRTDE